ncbi:hypothetical protein AV926_15885 [Myroides marinus]|uniref:Uncharacterized protein n=1 Tax=Myroides marinus TaxID=703342 RepID=A0A163WP44_9FLAO|nr:hypothetical protein [Myroides marinus]KZE76621.1 hypothetical protein AV926_15885 [Myroides marinus]
MRTLTLLLLIITNSLAAYSQINQRLKPKDQRYKDIIEELGNPLEGKPLMIINYMGNKTGSYLWYFNERKAIKPSYLSDKPTDILSGIYIEDHGGILEKVTFKDYAEGLSQPQFLFDYCLVKDMDNNNSPEFYLTYFMNSDGLDAKPLKVIVYTTKPNSNEFYKSKVTAYIPYQEEDKYHIEEDSNFKQLPVSIRKQALGILEQIKKKNIL